MLARWLEELAQYDMEIIHRKGIHHANADALSRIPDLATVCDCYHSWVKPEDLPCGGCFFCTRAHKEWARFEDEVEDVVPLSVKHVLATPSSNQYTLVHGGLQLVRRAVLDPDVDKGASSDEWVVWTSSKYSSDQLRDRQRQDSDVYPLVDWVENQRTPSQAEYQLCSPATKFFWTNSALLVVHCGVLYYKWIGDQAVRLLFIVPVSLQKEVLLS